MPVSYTYQFGSYLIRSLERVDEDLAAELHRTAPFKPYHFSRILARARKVEDGFIYFAKNTPATIYIASPSKEIMNGLMDAMLSRGYVQIRKNRYSIEGVEPVGYPPSTFNFATLSPVFVSVTEDGQKVALDPTDPLFHEELIQNVNRKYAHFYGRPFTGRLQIRYESVTPRMRTIKNTRIPCYDIKGKISGDEDVIKLIWDVGLGEKNALGFGMVGLWRRTQSQETESSS